ncbi:hypothetical protein [Frondihabitans australicus]|uniref:Uncharacterized protein n=1 Tax=Frondihabitans australicus TaxID=386892 RepID=A0A495IIU1_9MICO|nr:hypothetical protein [Frondihabitans australicus]RKR75942.1 hypothetical protein C8E83_3106 [Frondihabitans australicus]
MVEAVVVLVVVVALLVAIPVLLITGVRRRRRLQEQSETHPGLGLRAGDDPVRDEMADDFRRGRGANTGLNF